MPASGMPSGFQFSGLAEPSINNAGQSVFVAAVKYNSDDFIDNNVTLWSNRSGAVALLIRMGDPAPDLASTISIGRMQTNSGSPSPVINHDGKIVFQSSLIGAGVTEANDSALFSDGLGTGFRLAAREGDPAPGLTPGILFPNLTDVPYSINGNGQAAFIAATGIYAQDLTGLLHLIAGVGDSIEVAQGDFRRISTLSFIGATGNEDGRASAFNDLGQLAFKATFQGGSSGVFVSSAVMVPEPCALILAILCVLVVMTFHRVVPKNCSVKPGRRRRV